MILCKDHLKKDSKNKFLLKSSTHFLVRTTLKRKNINLSIRGFSTTVLFYPCVFSTL